jgi:hypothetical protein
MAKQQQMEVQRQAEVQRKTEMHGNVGIQKPKLEKESVAEPRMYEIDSPSSKKMAGFLSQFTCAVQNNSEHNIMEFFGDEIQAEELRSKLSPSGQADSISLREELHKFGEITDPVQTLICANKMKNFKPKAGILSGEQQYNLIEGLKNIVSTIIRNSDLSKFEIEDKNAILNMVKQIERSDSVNFGIETKLKQLVDNLNKNSLNFVKNLQTEATKILRRM